MLAPWKKSYDQPRQHIKKQRHYFTNNGMSSQGYIFSPCLFNLYAENITQNAGLDEAQAGIKIVGRNINNIRYADDTTIMAESEKELKSLLMKVKEESEKVGLKLSIQEVILRWWRNRKGRLLSPYKFIKRTVER